MPLAQVMMPLGRKESLGKAMAVNIPLPPRLSGAVNVATRVADTVLKALATGYHDRLEQVSSQVLLDSEAVLQKTRPANSYPLFHAKRFLSARYDPGMSMLFSGLGLPVEEFQDWQNIAHLADSLMQHAKPEKVLMNLNDANIIRDHGFGRSGGVELMAASFRELAKFMEDFVDRGLVSAAQKRSLTRFPTNDELRLSAQRFRDVANWALDHKEAMHNVLHFYSLAADTQIQNRGRQDGLRR